MNTDNRLILLVKTDPGNYQRAIKFCETAEQSGKFDGYHTKIRPFLLNLFKKWRGCPEDV